MKRSPIPPTVVFPAIAVGLLVLAFLYYYFPERIRREDALNRQAFRRLGSVAEMIQGVVSSYGRVLERWANAQGPDTANPDADKMRGFADQVPDLRYVKVEPRPGVPPAPPGPCPLQLNARSEFGQVLLRFQCGGHSADIPLETLVQRYIQGDPTETFDELLVTDGAGAVLYQTRRTGLHLRSLSGLLTMGAGDKNDKIPPKTVAGAQQASDMVKVSLGGAEYRLYTSPAPIRLHAADATPALDLILVGLVSEANVRTRALATPGSVQITVGLTAALVICIAWPLLKFRTMRASERVPRGAGLYFFVSSIVTVALLTVLGIHLWYRDSDFDDTQAKLERLADAIDNNVSLEARQAVNSLAQAMTSGHFRDAAAALEQTPTPCGQELPSYTINQRSGNVLTWLDFPVAGYPYFDQMFWVDKNGFQQIKWTVRSRATPATRLCQFQFFTETLQGHLWHFASGPRVSFRIDPLYSPNTGEYQAVISQPFDPATVSNLPRPPIAMTSMVTQMLSLIDPVVPPGYGFAMVDESGAVLFHSIAGRNGREQLYDEVEGDPAVPAAVFARTGGHLVTTYHGAPHRFFVRPLRLIQDCPWMLVTFRDLRPLSALQLQRTILLLVLTVAYLLLVFLIAGVIIRFRKYPSRWLWPREEMNARYLHVALSLLALGGLMYLVLIRASLTVSWIAALTGSVVSLALVAWKLQCRERRIRILAYLLLTAVSATVAYKTLWMHDLRWWQVGPLLLTACLVLQFCASEWFTSWIARTRKSDPNLPRTGKPDPRLPGFATSYTIMSISVLLLVPALPCICFFRIAYDYQENMFTRRAQLETMAALEDRVERVLRAYTNVKLRDGAAPETTAKTAASKAKVPAADGRVSEIFRALFLRARLDDVRLDRYDTVFAAGSGQEFSPGPRLPPDSPAPDRIQEPESRFWLLLQKLAALWGNADAATATFLNEHDERSTQWKWTLAGDRHLRLGPHFVRENENSSVASPPTAALARLVASNPVLLSEDLVSEVQVLEPGFWEAFAPLVLVGGFMYLLFDSTLSRMFLLRVSFEEPWPEIHLRDAVRSDRNLILIGLPRSGKSIAVEELRKAKQIYHIDLAELVMAAESTPVRPPRDPIEESVVVLDHFEFQCQDPESNRVKLELLEWLAHQPSKRVLIVTALDPVFYLFPGPIDDAGAPEGFAPGKYLDRWLAVFSGFEVRRLPVPAACHNDFYYQLVWAVCSRSERVALYQLARDGWPNHQNSRALEHLLQRGLIKRTPVFRIADGSFRTYIRNVVGQTDVSIWEKGETITVWDGVRIAFYILAVGVIVAVSIYNQQQVLAVLTTLLGVIPALGKVFRDSIGSGGGDKPAKGAGG